MQIKPESWNNIPLCLVKAIRIMIDVLVKYEHKVN